jgi:heme-degrading monooxygenase HmoA
MPVLMIGEVPNLSGELYDSMLEQMKPRLQAAPGFIAHSGGPSPNGGWRVVELWDSEADGQTWFEENVRPNLPPEIVPNRVYHQVHSAFTA